MKADMNAPLEVRATRTNRTVAAGSIERLVSLVGSMDREVSLSLLNDIPKELPCKAMLRRPCRFLVVLLGSTENLRCGKRILLCSMMMSSGVVVSKSTERRSMAGSTGVVNWQCFPADALDTSRHVTRKTSTVDCRYMGRAAIFPL